MKKLTHIAAALANHTLSVGAMSLVKGGNSNGSNSANSNQNGTPIGNDDYDPANVANMQDDEKRRQRPGGGTNTN